MKKYNYLNLLAFIPFFLGFYIAFSDDMFYEFEKSIFDFFRVLAPYADIPMRAVTEIGSAVGMILITIVIIVVSVVKKRFFGFSLPIVLTIIVSRIVNIALKLIIDRPRPDFKVFELSESSFPSGHSQNNMAFYIAILLVALMIAKVTKHKLVLKISLVLIPLVIGLTRVYFGVHFFSDVLSGWSAGFLVAYNMHYLYFKVIYPKFKIKECSDELS